MDDTRRQILKLGAVAGAVSVIPGLASALAQSITSTPRPLWRRGVDGQRRADLGNGRFFNPVLAGDRPDPTVIRDGDDYYATFSSFDYYPAVVIWHSRDLVNWTPIGPALRKPIGSIYAMDIAKHDGRYFIYIPAIDRRPPEPGQTRRTLTIYVIHAESMRGPWSDPIDMGIYTGIDPGHVVGEDGKRYLFLNDGQLYPISDDGLKAAGPRESVYHGWKYPQEWIDEGVALEGPKIIRKDGWFYMFSAEGGTAGPPTGHMVIVARSRSVRGPWENCPHNPIVRTVSAAEPWWSRGHATPVQGPDGRWWLTYHGYENGFRSLGRQMLLEPMEWTRDGWPRALGGDLAKPLPIPARTKATRAGVALSGPLTADALGSKLAFFRPGTDYLDRVTFDGGTMLLKGQGLDPKTSSPLAMIAGDRNYEVSVEIEILDGAWGGLLLWYDDKLFCGIGRSDKRQQAYKRGSPQVYGAPAGQSLGRRFHLKVVNDANVASFYSSSDGNVWAREISYEVSGYNHNMADGFLSLRPALFASGQGSVRFSSLHYAARA